MGDVIDITSRHGADEATDDEIMTACEEYCRAWGLPLTARASVRMVIQALKIAGLRVVRRP